MGGIFTISLDFELHWGGVEKWAIGPAGTYREYFLNTRNVIPKVLARFADHHIQATWATVGLLFHRTRAEMLAALPAVQPEYDEKRLSAYHYILEQPVGEDEIADPFHFGHELILKIRDTPGQEIGSHTFSHYYCNEPGQNAVQFAADLDAAVSATARYGITPTSLVFPRNQFNAKYLQECTRHGFTAVRSNADAWFWRIRGTNESMVKRLVRGADAYLPLTRNSYPLSAVSVKDGLPVCLPASRFLRPWHRREGILNRLKLNRVLQEMTAAAQHDEVYHLWWHPHNFGFFPKENMEMLSAILNHFDLLRQRHGMESVSMAGCAAKVLALHR